MVTPAVQVSDSHAVSDANNKHPSRAFLWQFLLFIMDIALLGFGLGLALSVRLALGILMTSLPVMQLSFAVILLYGLYLLLWLLALLYEGVYVPGILSTDSTTRIVKALSAGLVLSIVLAFSLHAGTLISRLVLFLWYGFNLLNFGLVRPYLIRYTLPAVGQSANWVGVAEDFGHLSAVMQRAGWRMNLLPLAYQNVENCPLLVSRSAQSRLPTGLLALWESQASELAFYDPEYDFSFLGAHTCNLHGAQIHVISHPLAGVLNRGLKRIIDLLLTLILLIVFSPLGFVIAGLVFLESRAWPLYGHERLGRQGKPFKLWKFRSMVPQADARLQELLATYPPLREEFARNFKLRNDPRITRIGRILRKTSLDELPQLWNVLRGDMSLIGPRPIVQDEVHYYRDAYPVVASIQPGMTGMWQVHGRNDANYVTRRAFDIYYVRNWSIWLDFSLLVQTLRALLFPETY